MKNVIVTVVIGLSMFAFTACVDVKSNDDKSNLDVSTANIVGAWERVQIDAVTNSGLKTENKVVRPNPQTPFAHDNEMGQFQQLEITDGRITMLHTDFITVEKASAPYKLEGKKIVTIDSDSASMADFEVQSINKDTLKLKHLGATEPSDVTIIGIYKRIQPQALATKTALWVTSERSVELDFDHRDNVAESAEIDARITGTVRPDNGAYITCEYDTRSDVLKLNYSELTVEKNKISMGSDDDSLRMSIEKVSFEIDRIRDNQSIVEGDDLSRSKDTDIQFRSAGHRIGGTLKNCTHTINRDGAELDIMSRCNGYADSLSGPDEISNVETKLFAKCLLEVK